MGSVRHLEPGRYGMCLHLQACIYKQSASARTRLTLEPKDLVIRNRDQRVVQRVSNAVI